MNTTATIRANVEPGGAGVIAHVGLHALGALADRLKLGHLLSSRIPARGERSPLHDRGKVLTHMALVLAGGGESCADIEHLRLQRDLFGIVASDSTVHRTFHELSPTTLRDLHGAVAHVRAKVWDQLGLTASEDPVLLDIDASLVEVHSENKEGAAPHFKGGYGFHPMLCFADATGEALAAQLRPGNAGANTDANQSLEGALRSAGVGHDPRDDRAHAAPRDAHQLRDRGLRGVGHEPGHLVIEVAGVAGAVTGPGHLGDRRAVSGTLARPLTDWEVMTAAEPPRAVTIGTRTRIGTVARNRSQPRPLTNTGSRDWMRAACVTDVRLSPMLKKK